MQYLKSLLALTFVLSCTVSSASDSKEHIDDVNNLYGFKGVHQFLSLGVQYDPMLTSSIDFPMYSLQLYLDVPMFKFEEMGGMLNRAALEVGHVDGPGILTVGAEVDFSVGLGRGYDVSPFPVGIGLVGTVGLKQHIAYSYDGKDLLDRILFDNDYVSTSSAGQLSFGYGIQCNIGFGASDPHSFLVVSAKVVNSTLSLERTAIQVSYHSSISLRSLNGSKVSNR